MKKYLFRAAVFTLTFAIGIGLIWSVSSFNFDNYQQPEITVYPVYHNENGVEVSPNGEIEVYFKEFVSEKDGLAMKFEISNKNVRTAYYSANGYEKNVKTGDLIPALKIDGSEKKRFICGSGLETFELKSGEKIEYTLKLWHLTYDFQKGETFQIGFGFSHKSNEDYQTSWSENLPITSEIKQQMLKEFKEFEKKSN